jgi:hypothetical protein
MLQHTATGLFCVLGRVPSVASEVADPVGGGRVHDEVVGPDDRRDCTRFLSQPRLAGAGCCSTRSPSIMIWISNAAA